VYEGPLRSEPLAVELHNTLYASGGELVDGLDAPKAFLTAVAGRLPDGLPPGPAPSADELIALRGAIRATLPGPARDRAALAVLNATAARAPTSPAITRTGSARTDWHGATRADAVLALFAADAIRLLTEAADLHACGAPGCVLLYLRDHPRRRWCCNGCGNRARQARHYARTARSGGG
jgi:predicted RNA-binding Zn ribbon-like protein